MSINFAGSRLSVDMSEVSRCILCHDPETRRPKLIGNRCVGCHLCRLVCSTEAIGKAGKAVYRPVGSDE